MYYLNPEFQRNMWLQYVPQKFLAAPFVLMAILYAGYMVSDEWTAVMSWAVWLYALITIAYGAYLAGDTISDEIQEHTWPMQKMLDISPWSMTWGKVFGGTLFAWYVGALLLLTILLVPLLGFDIDHEIFIHAHPFQSVVYLIGLAIFFHGFALLFSLVHLQKTHSMIKRTIIVPIVSLMLATIYVPYLLSNVPAESSQIVWFYQSIPEFSFFTMTVYLNAAWMLIGALMLMRHELQYINNFGVWVAFLVFQSLFFIGLTYAPDIKNFEYINVYDRTLDLPIMSLRIGIVFLISFICTYVLAAIEKIEIVEIRHALQHDARGKLTLLFDVLPRWVLTMGFTIGLGLLLLISIAFEGYMQIETATIVFALFAFMLRDIGIFMIYDLTGKKRHLTTAIVYLITLYLIIPTILYLMHMTFLLPWFHPHPDFNMMYAVAAPSLQAILVWMIARRRFAASK